jgi:hypothetical protein
MGLLSISALASTPNESKGVPGKEIEIKLLTLILDLKTNSMNPGGI